MRRVGAQSQSATVALKLGMALITLSYCRINSFLWDKLEKNRIFNIISFPNCVFFCLKKYY